MGNSFNHVRALDGVRALAVLLVVGFHARSGLFPGGYIGVDVFFVLSGFLITTLLLREHDAIGRVSYLNFYARRALRLLPAVVLVCAVIVPVFLLVPQVTERESSLLGAVGAITYTSSLLAAGGHDLGWMIPTWSLSVEEYFYFVWPIALVLLARRGNVRPWVLGLTAAAIGYRWASAFTDWSIGRISYAPDTRSEQLLIGCALAVILARRTWRVHRVAAPAALGALCLFVVAPAAWTGPAYRWGASSVVAILVVVVIIHAVTDPESLLTRLLNKPALSWIGKRSYGIYLWNLPIVAIVATTPIPGAVQMPIKLALSFIVPAISYRYVELPFLRIKGRFAPPESPRKASVGGRLGELGAEDTAHRTAQALAPSSLPNPKGSQ